MKQTTTKPNKHSVSVGAAFGGFKSRLSRYRNLENRNKAFHALTDRQKRQEIAWDALNLLMARKVKAEKGKYWSPKLVNIKAKTPGDFQKKLVEKLPANCEVCARGLMMLSQIRLGNTVDPRDNERSCGSNNNIEGFSYGSFDIMEDIFELFQYTELYEDEPNKRAANICCNVIKNGDYKPSDKTDYLTKWGITIK